MRKIVSALFEEAEKRSFNNDSTTVLQLMEQKPIKDFFTGDVDKVIDGKK